MERRTFVKGAAWSVPVIAAAVSVPAAAASEPYPTHPTRERITFTHFTATQGPKPNTIYVKTMVMVTDGEPVTNLTLAVSLSRDGETIIRQWPAIAGHGNTGTIPLEFEGIPKGTDVIVAGMAWADGVTRIDDADTVKTPGWWK